MSRTFIATGKGKICSAARKAAEKAGAEAMVWHEDGCDCGKRHPFNCPATMRWAINIPTQLDSAQHAVITASVLAAVARRKCSHKSPCGAHAEDGTDNG